VSRLAASNRGPSRASKQRRARSLRSKIHSCPAEHTIRHMACRKTYDWYRAPGRIAREVSALMSISSARRRMCDALASSHLCPRLVPWTLVQCLTMLVPRSGHDRAPIYRVALARTRVSARLHLGLPDGMLSVEWFQGGIFRLRQLSCTHDMSQLRLGAVLVLSYWYIWDLIPTPNRCEDRIIDRDLEG
jgi:hypothetical protein